MPSPLQSSASSLGPHHCRPPGSSLTAHPRKRTQPPRSGAAATYAGCQLLICSKDLINAKFVLDFVYNHFASSIAGVLFDQWNFASCIHLVYQNLYVQGTALMFLVSVEVLDEIDCQVITYTRWCRMPMCHDFDLENDLHHILLSC